MINKQINHIIENTSIVYIKENVIPKTNSINKLIKAAVIVPIPTANSKTIGSVMMNSNIIFSIAVKLIP